MTDEWQVAEGTGWITLPGYGRVDPRRDDVGGGRQYFTAKTEDDGYAQASGPGITGGPETWHYEYDRAFWLDGRTWSLEMEISLLEGGRYALKYREGRPPSTDTGGW